MIDFKAGKLRVQGNLIELNTHSTNRKRTISFLYLFLNMQVNKVPWVKQSKQLIRDFSIRFLQLLELTGLTDATYLERKQICARYFSSLKGSITNTLVQEDLEIRSKLFWFKKISALAMQLQHAIANVIREAHGENLLFVEELRELKNTTEDFLSKRGVYPKLMDGEKVELNNKRYHELVLLRYEYLRFINRYDKVFPSTLFQ